MIDWINGIRNAGVQLPHHQEIFSQGPERSIKVKSNEDLLEFELMVVAFDGRNDVKIEWLDVLPLPSSGIAAVVQ